MEEYPECSICLDIFGNNISHIKAPKILKCGDTFCKECLEKIIKNTKEDFFLCPLCKKEIRKEKDVDEYSPNKEVIKIVNTFFNISKIEIEKGEPPIQYNVILLGSSGVGKTSIFTRLSKDIFTEHYSSTIGVDIITYYIKYKSKKYELIIQDTAGQEHYKSLTKSFFRQKDGVLFIYDITNQSSFNDLESWFDLYKKENGNNVGLLIGNKCDDERKVNEEEAKKFAFEHGLKYIETSAKLDKNIKKAIAILLEKIIRSKETQKEEEIESNEKLAKTYYSLKAVDISVTSQGKRQKKKCGC